MRLLLVEDLGWVFELRDNHRDIYKDTPPWSDNIIAAKPDGSLQEGYEWSLTP